MKTKYFYKGLFSQWHKSPFKDDFRLYNCAEQYMMYWKARLCGDYDIGIAILATTSPAEAKSLGRAVRNFDQELWDMLKFEIVVQGNVLKFKQNDDLRISLMKYDKFVECSPVDKIWGIGLPIDSPDKDDESKWSGQNLLGKAIEECKRRILQ